MSATSDQNVFDIVIAGASFAGMALAKALSIASHAQFNIAILDRADPIAPRRRQQPDARAFALSASSCYLLEHLGIWPAIAAHAQPVEKIEITDSSLDAGVRPVLLAWDNVLSSGDPASYIVPSGVILEALSESVRNDPSITTRHAQIASTKQTARDHIVRLEDGSALTAKLLIAADGQNSPLRQMMGIDIVKWTYDQHGIVTTIAHAKPHHATAVQHFLPAGPFAMLPLQDRRSCITWSESTPEAERIVDSDDGEFHAELDQRLAGRLGSFDVVGPRQSWPLSMHLARGYVADRFALIGDAAHGVHPLAGQGLNLGLRDVAALVDVVVQGASLGLDIGRYEVLQRYERWRRSDTAISAASFDGLNRLFSNDVAILRSMREVGLGTVDRLQGLKDFFISEAAGQAGEIPKLMQKQVA